jgi:serine/threonine-protein kinase ULK/ATG1
MDNNENMQGLYALEDRVLGKGSFGTVYLGVDLANDRYVSLKKIPPEIKEDPQKINALSNEILISAGVDNINLVKILDLTDIGTDKYIVYEFCNGGDLRRYLRYFKRFDERAVQYFMMQVLNGLKELHEKKIIHHDLKPENVLVELIPFEVKDNKNIEEKKNSKKMLIKNCN